MPGIVNFMLLMTKLYSIPLRSIELYSSRQLSNMKIILMLLRFVFRLLLVPVLRYYLLRSLLNALNIQNAFLSGQLKPKWFPALCELLKLTYSFLIILLFLTIFLSPNLVEFHDTYAQTGLAKDLRRLLKKWSHFSV